MQRIALTAQMFDRHNMAKVDRCQKPDTGIDRLIDQAITDPAADQNRTGAAIALGTAFLCPGQARLKPQKIEQCVGGSKGVKPHLAGVQDETNFGSRVGIVCICHGIFVLQKPADINQNAPRLGNRR